MTRTVLVTDGEQRAALAVTRSLGRAGWRVIVLAGSRAPLAGASRWCSAEVRVPDPVTSPLAFSDAVVALVAEYSASLVLPIGEGALLALSTERARLGSAVLPWPADPVVHRVLDKADVLSAAEGLDIAVPQQLYAASAGEVAASAAQLGYPLVLKPARSIGEAAGARRKVGVVYAADAASLSETLRGLAPQAWPLLVQRRLRGQGLGVFMLRWDGRIIARFAHVREREKPPSGGVSVLSRSVPLSHELAARVERLLAALDWQGVAMVEFKADDDRGGLPTLMEINGRFWGSLQLAIDAGVDFPRLLAACASGEAPAPVLRWTEGVRLRWGWGDRDHLLAVGRAAWRGGGLRATWRAWRDWRAGIGRAHGEVWRLADWRPGLRESVQWLTRR